LLQITPARLVEDGEDVSKSSDTGVAPATAAAAATSGSALHVVVRHQGTPERPEFGPPKFVDQAQLTKPNTVPKIRTDAQGRPIAAPLQRRNATVYGRGRTAIKLNGAANATAAAGNTSDAAAAVAEGNMDGARRKLLQNAAPHLHSLLVLYTDAAAAGGCVPLKVLTDAAAAAAAALSAAALGRVLHTSTAVARQCLFN
jgi:hypothetical protein